MKNKRYILSLSEAELDVIECALDMQIEMCTDSFDWKFEEEHKSTTDKAKIVWNKLQKVQKRSFTQFYPINKKSLTREII